mmetsp:Transcript_17192/g.23893  ORF Transcript_17192/g.23893 Transcript_17192/m.23893 type:complete len:81 (+) Transcript_17192:1591-1833(+)
MLIPVLVSSSGNISTVNVDLGALSSNNVVKISIIQEDGAIDGIGVSVVFTCEKEECQCSSKDNRESDVRSFSLRNEVRAS